MATGIGLAFAATVVVALTVAFLHLHVRYRGRRLVTCPETHLPAATEVDASLAARAWLTARPHFVVTACSRWPERAGCDEACVPQIEAAPQETLVWNIVARWYGERTCVFCTRPIREIGGIVVPAMLGPEGRLREWKDVVPEDLPSILGQSVAVCATCEIAEDFRRRFPDRVLDRPSSTLRKRSAETPRRIGAPSQAIY